MEVTPLAIPDVLLVAPKVFGDDRGYFFESWQLSRYCGHGVDAGFVQDNFSRSGKGILRGLHLQHPHGQGKLVSVLEGEVFDVAVDVRHGSPTFGRHVHATLSGKNHHQLWIPAGFAHGFCVTSDHAVFHYKCSEAYHPECEVGVAWDDPDLGIPWPAEAPQLSQKDQANPRLRDIDRKQLPVWVAKEQGES